METLIFYFGALVLIADHLYKIFLQPPPIPNVYIRRKHRDLEITAQTFVSIIEVIWLISGLFTTVWYCYLAIILINIISSVRRRKEDFDDISLTVICSGSNILICIFIVIYTFLKNFI
jgi:hypothetical protein